MVKIKCKWCGNEFQQEILYKSPKTGTITRNQVKCKYCSRSLPSSIKETTDNVNRKHIHREFK